MNEKSVPRKDKEEQKVSKNSFSKGCGPFNGTAGPTFAEYQTVFMTQIARTRSGNTVLSYSRILARAGRVWGEYRLADITKVMVRSYVEKLLECYRHSTVCLHFDMLRCFFRTAVEDEVIVCSPMQSLKKPARSKDDSLVRSGKAYTESEMRFVLKCMDSEPLKYRAMVYFMADSGCRRGEVCGLTWDCVDFSTGVVVIRNNAQSFPCEGVKVLAPKSGKERVIVLNSVVLNIMREWKQEQYRLCARKGIKPSLYCFSNSKGNVMNPGVVNVLFRTWGKRYGIADFRPHRLRHTMATISIANGADIVSISKKLGHSSPSITLNVYSHVNEEALRRANLVLARAIYG